MQGAEGIREPGLKQQREPGALLVAEPGGKTVLPGTGDVDLLMGYIQIPAEDDRLGFRQGRHILAERSIPLFPVREAHQLVLGIGGIAVDQVKLFKLHRAHAPLPVMLRPADSGGRGKGLHTAKDQHAGITGLLRRIPELVRPGGNPQVIHLFRTRLDLLKAEDVRLQRLHGVPHSLAEDRPQSVHIP